MRPRPPASQGRQDVDRRRRNQKVTHVCSRRRARSTSSGARPFSSRARSTSSRTRPTTHGNPPASSHAGYPSTSRRTTSRSTTHALWVGAADYRGQTSHRHCCYPRRPASNSCNRSSPRARSRTTRQRQQPQQRFSPVHGCQGGEGRKRGERAASGVAEAARKRRVGRRGSGAPHESIRHRDEH